MNAEKWEERAGKNISASVLGVTCPDCLKVLPVEGNEHPATCKCGNVMDLADVLAVHGLDQLEGWVVAPTSDSTIKQAVRL